MPATASARRTDAVLRDVVRLFHQAQRTLTTCCAGATAKECEALMLIASGGPLTVQAFADRMGLEKTWASRLLVRMEGDGLVRRTPNPADARSLLIQLTAKGRAERGRLSAGLDTQAADLLACVPAGERANVVRALEHLRTALETCLTRCPPDAPPRRGPAA